MNSTLLMSVVMPTCGRPVLLRRCLEALLRQSLPHDAYEIVVVDDGRSDATQAVVAELASQPGVPCLRYVQPPAGSRGPAGARNAGWRAAASPIIAFTDDDTIPDSRWLEEGYRALTAPEAGACHALWGHVSVPVPAVPTDNEKNTKGLEGAVFVTANAFALRSALETVGGFDERYKRAWREDTDLYFALLRAGFTVRSAPAAIVLHPAREAPWGVSMAQQANAAFEALLYKKYPQLYRDFVLPKTPWLYYIAVGSALLTLVSLVAQQPGWAAAFAITSLGVIGHLAWRRLSGTSHDPRHVAEMVVTSFALPFLSVYWRLRGALQYRVLFF